MKKLLLLGLMFSLIPSAHAIYLIDNYGSRFQVLCVSNYVFIRNLDGGVTQVMQKSPTTSNKSHTTPMSCSEYKKVSKD